MRKFLAQFLKRLRLNSSVIPFFEYKGHNMEEGKRPEFVPTEFEVAQEIALKAASDIAIQVEFAVLDASETGSLPDAAKRFDAILHYAERALGAIERLHQVPKTPNSVQ